MSHTADNGTSGAGYHTTGSGGRARGPEFRNTALEAGKARKQILPRKPGLTYKPMVQLRGQPHTSDGGPFTGVSALHSREMTVFTANGPERTGIHKPKMKQHSACRETKMTQKG